MTQLIFNLLRFWEAFGATACMALGFLGLAWCLLRWYYVEREHPLVRLRARFD